ncbi:MAG: hypothetical protein ABSE54_03225 [Smithella sp.]|jgi:hypothetical protein
MEKKDDKIARDAIFRVKRGLCGYVSYLAACKMNQAFSEYVLYEPILRILTARNYVVSCEYVCPGIAQPARGDKKRLDFYATRSESSFAIEVKWLTSSILSIEKDTEKLQAFHREVPNALAFLLIFGRKSYIEKIYIDRNIYKEWGKAVYADLRKTRYGCRVYRIIAQS